MRADARERRLRVRRDDVRAALGQARLPVRDAPPTPPSRTSSKAPEPPSAKAPRGWVTKDVDAVRPVAPREGPRAAPEGRRRACSRRSSRSGAPSPRCAPRSAISAGDRSTTLVDALVAAPDDAEAAIALEKAIDEGAEPTQRRRGVRDRRRRRSSATDEDELETKKTPPLPRRAHLRRRGEGQGARRARSTPRSSSSIRRTRSPSIALEEVRKALGKYDEIVEMLLARSEKAAAGRGARAHLRRDRPPLRDRARGSRSRRSSRTRRRSARRRLDDEYAAEIERLAGGKADALERGPRRR